MARLLRLGRSLRFDMTHNIQPTRVAVTRFGGDLSGLLRQLGAGWSLVAFEAGAEAGLLEPPSNRQELADRVAAYQEGVLLRHELPAIHRAFYHASRRETRELVELDQSVGLHLPPTITPVSRRVGRAQLARMRPLTDDRVVQRYLHAVSDGQAEAWHPVVLGLTLAVYSIPVLQGMIAFERQSLAGFLEAAARPLGLPQQDWEAIHDSLPPAVARFVRVLHREGAAAVRVAES